MVKVNWAFLHIFIPLLTELWKTRQCQKKYFDLVVSYRYWLFVKFDHTPTNSERQCCLNWPGNVLLCVLRYFAAIRENSLNLNLPSPSITLRAATIPHKSGSRSFFQWHLLLYISNVFLGRTIKSFTLIDKLQIFVLLLFSPAGRGACVVFDKRGSQAPGVDCQDGFKRPQPQCEFGQNAMFDQGDSSHRPSRRRQWPKCLRCLAKKEKGDAWVKTSLGMFSGCSSPTLDPSLQKFLTAEPWEKTQRRTRWRSLKASSAPRMGEKSQNSGMCKTNSGMCNKYRAYELHAG